MVPRRLAYCLSAALSAALVGCGSGGQPAAKPGAVPVSAAARARKDLISISKKIEDPAGIEAIETYVKKIEDPEQGWTWSDLDDSILRGNFSIQTKIAYEKWRDAKLKEGAKR